MMGGRVRDLSLARRRAEPTSPLFATGWRALRRRAELESALRRKVTDYMFIPL